MNRLLVVLFLFPISAAAQVTKSSEFAFSPGVIIQKEVFAELNVTIGTIVADNMAMGISGMRVGAESNLKSGSGFTIAPKVGYEFDLVLFASRISVITYFQDGRSEFRIVPEIGFSIGGFANLTYGYGIRFANGSIDNLSQHRVSLTFNLHKKLINELM